jgi:hypothetical protein
VPVSELAQIDDQVTVEIPNSDSNLRFCFCDRPVESEDSFQVHYYPSGQRGPILGRDIVQNSRYFFQMGERRHLAGIQGDNLSSGIGGRPSLLFRR